MSYRISLSSGTGAKASKGKGLKMLGLDAGAAGFDFSVQSNEQVGQWVIGWLVD